MPIRILLDDPKDADELFKKYGIIAIKNFKMENNVRF